MKKLPEILTQDEIQKLLDTPNQRYRTGKTQYLIMRVSLETGMRISELINLKREHINFLTGQTRIENGKGGKDRITFLTKETRNLILSYWETIGESDYCFSNLSGGQLQSSNLRRTIKKLGNKCGVERVHWHLLRHTALTNYYTQTKDIRLVQEIAGHSSIQTTQIYSHISGENIKETLLNSMVIGG